MARLLAPFCPVSIVGLAGMGKSRLAREVAYQRPRAGLGHPVVVDASGCSSSAELAQQVAASFGWALPRGQARPVLEALSQAQALLVLDGCDNLGAEAMEWAGRLAANCPGLAILLTAQAPPRLPGEQVVRLGPLSVPEAERPAPDELLAHDAPKLLLAAAAAAGARTYDVTDRPAAADIAALCRHVNGIPLGLEVAGDMLARVGARELAGALERYRWSSDVPAGCDRSQAHAAATLHRALDGLGPLPRRLVEVLSVLPAGADVGQLVAVSGTSRARRPAVVSAVADLARASVVRCRADGEAARYELPLWVRLHVLAEVGTRGELEELKRRALRWCLEMVSGATQALVSGSHQGRLLDRLAEEYPNLRSSLEHALARGDAEAAARLAEGLWRFWELRGMLSEGRSWLERCLLAGPVSPGLRARLLDGAGMLAWRQGDFAPASQAFNEALATIGHRPGDMAIRGRLHNHLGLVSLFSGDIVGSTRTFEVALAELEAALCPGEAAAVRANLALAAIEEGRLSEAGQLLDDALAVQVAVGDRHGQAICLLHRSIARYYSGDRAGAASDARGATSTFNELGDRRNLAFSLLVLAGCLAELNPGLSVQLAGLGQDMYQDIGAYMPGSWHQRLEEAMAPAKEVLGHKAEHLRRQGAALSLPAALAAVDESLAGVPAPALSGRPAAPEQGRTWARVEVLGRWRVTRFGRTVALAPQVARLLKLIACRAGLAHVDEVLEVLWPGASPERGRRRLRNVLARLARSAGPLVERRGECLALAEGVGLDAAMFETSARQALSLFANQGKYHEAAGAARAAEALYTGDLLPTDPYEGWADEPRQRLARLRLRLLEAWASAARDIDPDAAEQCLRLAVMADPADEAHYLMLADLLYDRGRRGAALEVLAEASSWAAGMGFDVSPAVAKAIRRMSMRP